jgi:hypothetical protein
VFGKNYYSLPSAWIGKQVLVFAWAGKLRVHDEQGAKFVYAHRIIKNATGKYQVPECHLGEIHRSTQERFAYLLNQFDGLGRNLGAFARKLHGRYGIFALRRLWTLRGLVNQHGAQTVNEASRLAESLRDLARILSVWSELPRSNPESGEGLQIFNAI